MESLYVLNFYKRIIVQFLGTIKLCSRKDTNAGTGDHYNVRS